MTNGVHHSFFTSAHLTYCTDYQWTWGTDLSSLGWPLGFAQFSVSDSIEESSKKSAGDIHPSPEWHAPKSA